MFFCVIAKTEKNPPNIKKFKKNKKKVAFYKKIVNDRGMFNKKGKEQTMLKTNENGRSMVEMLGVLAIIGVLSVAGIAGYSMAMKRYKANEVVNIASTLYTLAEAKYLLDSNAGSYTATQAGLTLPSGITSMTYTHSDGKITIAGAGDLCSTIISIAGNAEYTIDNSSCS